MIIPTNDEICDIKALCTKYMPMMADLHKGLDIPKSLTEYQCLTNKISGFNDLFALDDALAKDMLILSHTFARWLKFGMSVIKPTASLMAALLLTDPTNVDPKQVQPPFPTFVLKPPPKMFYSTGLHGDDEEIRMIIVSHSASVTDPPGEKKVLLEDAMKMQHRSLISLSFIGPTVFLVDSLPVLGESEFSMSEWLTADRKKSMWMDVEKTKRDNSTILAFRRFYVNLCLYISQRGKGKKEQKYSTKRAKRRRKKKGEEQKMTPETWVIGQDVKVDKELLQAAKDKLSGTGTGKYGWKIRKRSITRGHWRNQAHGPGRAERKRIWIEPFWRGPRAGEQIQHFYTTEEKNG